MINFAVVLSALMTLLCFSNQGLKNNNNYIVHKTGNSANVQAVSNASISDPAVSSLFNSLSTGTTDDLLIDDYYEGVYFSNLRENFGNNILGSCSYVSIGMILSFYDSYWSDSFIPEACDAEPTSVFTTYPSADFSFPSFYAESPGVLFEPTSEISSLSLEEYLLYASAHSNTYFQCELISLSQSYFGEAKFEDDENPFGMTFADMLGFLGYYLYDYRSFNTSQITISSCNESNSVRTYAINKIKSGIPVILGFESSTLGGHSFIAYDYDEANDEIYVHTGWRDEDSGKTLSHVSLSSTGFTSFCYAISLDVSMPSTFSYNYHSTLGEDGSARNIVFPQDIEMASGNYRDELPTFKWKSIYKERWIETYNPYFDLSILNLSSYQIFRIDGITSKGRTLTAEQWNTVLDTSSNVYYAYIELDSDTYAYLDEYYAKKGFNKPLEYNQLPQIKPNEYGFDDAYPNDDSIKNNFISHTASHGFAFETRRFRTGYIHNEYIVMSPISSGFQEAFIEYRFSYAVTRIDVELAHWRPTSHEWLTSSTGEASVQYYWEDGWVDKLDLLSSETALPTDRNSHTFYKLEFDNPVYRVRFYAETFSANTNDSNRGRICIGNMAFYLSNYNLPLSGGELEYNPDIWSGVSEENNNCYAYALNNQVKPWTTTIWYKQQPGEYSGNTCYIYDRDHLVNAVIADFARYNHIHNTNLLFNEIGKNEKCPRGTYKVALVAYSGDYHWYRQDADGYWSHKPGTTPVRRYDDNPSTNNLILDPQLAYRGNYTTFIGYFVVSPWGNMYE